MSDATTGDLKLLLEQAAVRDDRRHEANVEWRTRLDGAVRTLTDEVVAVKQRQDLQERKLERHEFELAVVAGRSTEAMGATAELEGKLIAVVNGQSTRFVERLVSQDKEIAHIKVATDAQTPILAKLQEHMAGAQANGKLLRWLIPLTGGAITVIVPTLWWVFELLKAAH